MNSRFVAVKLLLPFLALLSVAQESPAPEQESPVTTLHANTRLVVLDVVVTDKKGAPIRDLSQSDFMVLEDGKEQSISSFEPPDEHRPVTIENDSADENTLPQGGSPKIGAAPLTILVFDSMNTKIMDQAFARFEIKKFLVAHGPRLSEPTALMAVEENRLELLHDYTRDAKALEAALQQHRAELPSRLLSGMGFSDIYSATDPVEASERFADTIGALREIATANTQFAGRKNVIWIGPGFPSLDHVNVPPAAKSRLYIWGRETMDLISQARLVVYTLNPRGLEVYPDEVLSPMTNELAFESIASLTGGRIFRGLNDLDSQIESGIEDGEAYYAIGYYPSNRNWDGTFRRVRVLMRNSNVTARTRAGYYGDEQTAPTYQQLDTLLSRAVINPLPYHALAVQATAKVSGSQNQTASLTVEVDASGLHWQNEPGDKYKSEITIAAAGFSAKGKVVAQNVKELEVLVDDTKYALLLKHGMVVNLAMALPPTAVRMRVVARDSTNGNMGTADLTPTGEQFH
ncbi:MAG TPA: VWA domain-containing protein [Terriglobales bacterium]|jgi:VWFA-related protein|nr:VWA domain-containing protein [Terriglobales bacterium]